MATITPIKPPDRTDYQQALESLGTYVDITVDDLLELTRRAQRIARRRATASLDVRQIMSQPVRTVHPQTPLAQAAHIMVSERVSGLPVVDNEGRLLGLVTEADFLRALGVPTPSASHSVWQTLEGLFSHLTHHTDLEAPTDPVDLHMVRNVQCVRPDQSVQDVLDAMKEHAVKRVVVCDDQRRVMGMVTRSDLVRVFFDRYT